MTRYRTLTIAFGLVFALTGCSKSDETKTKAPPPTPAEQAPPKPAAPPAPAERKPVEGPMADALVAYDAIHVALFTDQTAGVADAAAVLADAATKAAEAASDAHRAHYAALAAAAGELAKAADVKAARLAFGEVSKHVVMLMEMDAALAAGRHVFECPMAEGYKKWIQPTGEIANPYMGSSMPKCGAEVAFAAPAAAGAEPAGEGHEGHGGH